MKEILFRGKRIDNGEWIEGYAYHNECLSKIISALSYRGEKDGFVHYCEAHNVYPYTVSQYTGLCDMNCCPIFEGDIVRVWQKHNGDKKKYRAIVEFGNPNGEYTWGWQLRFIDDFPYNKDILCWIEMEETGAYCEVIGNKWDNPELIKKEN